MSINNRRMMAIVGAISLLGVSAAANAQEKTALVFAHGFAPNMSWSKGAVKFKEAVERETKGALGITIYDSAILGEHRQNIEAIIDSGTNHLTIALEDLSPWVPEINVYQLLYLFRDIDHLMKFEEGPVGKELKDIVTKKTGLRVLTYFPREARQLSTRNKAVKSIEDVQGLKIRVTTTKAAIGGWTAIGAKPVPMAWGEVFTSLRQGVLDAQENPFDHMVSRKTYEVTKYGARTDHVFASVWVVMSDKKYKALPATLQKAVDKSALEAHKYERALNSKESAEALDKLKAGGMTITEPDLAPFRAAARKSHESFPELKAWVDKVQAIK